MPRFVADHNFNEHIVRGFVRTTGADVVLVRDVGLDEAEDPDILEWAAREGRVLLTHDGETMIGFAQDRIRAGLPTSSVLHVKSGAAIGRAIDDLAFFAECASEEDCHNLILYLPWPG